MTALAKNKKKIIETVILTSVGIIMFLLFCRIFYGQITAENFGNFPSDIGAHIKFAKEGRGYSYLYKIMGVLMNTFDDVITIAIFESLMVVGTWFATAKLVSMMMKNLDYFKSAMIALPLLIITGMYLPVIYPHLYAKQLITQPYHNITYYGMRLLATFAMIFFYKMFDGYLSKINGYYWIALAALLAASTSVKPSFLYGFAFCLLIFLLIDFFQSGWKAKPFGHIVMMGLVVLPSLLIMLSQYLALYGEPAVSGATRSGITLIWGERFVKYGFWSTILKLICNLGFPCLVAIANRKKLSRFDKFCYVMFLIELAVSMMFAETGVRKKDGNFYWGVYCGAYFMFIAAVTNFIKNLMERKKDGKILTPYTITGGIMLIIHLISSISYFVVVVSGGWVFM